ncbi:hypothetical protein Bandiella_01236 [Candidatus Bandiella woodruffii]|uniref:Uncharacterized protein n=1 Tax=Candidatus Bandiella euplotis TaxID=1664265 RepID=A0ABZ0UMD1_9RICK|nr:hypothetical protein Bandiella_01236 [Candidatus Bandiella woodruffii]
MKRFYTSSKSRVDEIYRRQRTWKRARNTSDEHEERTKVRDEMRSPKYFDANFSSYRSIYTSRKSRLYIDEPF